MITFKRAVRVFTAPDRYEERAYAREVRAVRNVGASCDTEALAYLSDVIGWRKNIRALQDRAADMWEAYLSQLGGVSDKRDGAWVVDAYENVYFTCAEPDGGTYTECETGYQEEFSFDCQAYAILWAKFLEETHEGRDIHVSINYYTKG
jgi:hypothetical protein